MKQSNYKWYMAGPLFTDADRDFMLKLTNEVEALGFETYLPQRDGEVLAHDDNDSESIFINDMEAIDRCDGIIAVLNGKEQDSGTAFELGVAFEQEMNIIMYTDDTRIQSPRQINPMLSESGVLFIDKNSDRVELFKYLHQFAKHRIEVEEKSTPRPQPFAEFMAELVNSNMKNHPEPEEPSSSEKEEFENFLAFMNEFVGVIFGDEESPIDAQKPAFYQDVAEDEESEECMCDDCTTERRLARIESLVINHDVKIFNLEQSDFQKQIREIDERSQKSISKIEEEARAVGGQLQNFTSDKPYYNSSQRDAAAYYERMSNHVNRLAKQFEDWKQEMNNNLEVIQRTATDLSEANVQLNMDMSAITNKQARHSNMINNLSSVDVGHNNVIVNLESRVTEMSVKIIELEDKLNALGGTACQPAPAPKLKPVQAKI